MRGEDVVAFVFPRFSLPCSLAICQEWAQRDARFKIATAPKSGAVSATRNYGIDHAVGEYLVVIDGDDWIAPDMLEKLTAKLNQTGSLDVLAFACAEQRQTWLISRTAPKRQTSVLPTPLQASFPALRPFAAPTVPTNRSYAIPGLAYTGSRFSDAINYTR